MFAQSVDFRWAGRDRVVLSAEDWLAALHDPATELRIDRRCVGTLVRADGWSCDSRRVDSDWVLLALEGHSDGRAGETGLSLEPGMMMWLPAGTEHSMRWTQVFRYAEVYFALLRQGVHLCLDDRPRVFGQAGAHKRAIDVLAEEVQLGGMMQAARVRSLLATLVIDILRGSDSQAGSSDAFTRAQQARLVEFVRSRGAAGLTPGDLADALSLSSDYFSRRFRVTFGVSPRTWLNRRRIDAAALLLDQTNQPVYAVADELGYGGVAQFSRQFRQVMGVSPRAYRNR